MKKEHLKLLATLALAMALSACASMHQAGPPNPIPTDERSISMEQGAPMTLVAGVTFDPESDEQPPFVDPEHRMPLPAGVDPYTGMYTGQGGYTTVTEEVISVEVVGESSTDRQIGRADLWADYVESYFPNVKVTAVYDNSLGENVIVRVPSVPGAQRPVHISGKLKQKLIAYGANPQEAEGLVEVCKIQAGNTNEVLRLARQHPQRSQRQIRTSGPREHNPPCPGNEKDCVQSSFVSNVTHWGLLYGGQIDLVDAWDPNKPPGSCASKIWNDERHGGRGNRVQVVRYNGVGDPELYRIALARAITLLEVRNKYTTGTCLYVLHQ